MSKTVRVRISALGKDVSVLRLSTSEIKTLFHSVSIDPEELLSLSEVSPGSIDADDMDVTMLEAMESEFYNYTVVSVVLTLERCIKDFEEKIIHTLECLDNDDLLKAIRQLYREAVLVNPTLDYMAHSIYSATEPLNPDLERLTYLLPDDLYTSILGHFTREAITDRFLVDDTVADTMVYDVPDGSVELMDEVELTLDIEKVRSLSAELSLRMIGQRHAIEHITGVARRVAVGFRDPSRPPAVVMCVGPTGVGKTMLAKESADILFGNKAFGRIDCAQISEKHAVSKLIGAPPGYVGYPTKTKEGEDVKKMDPALIYKETLGLEDGGILLFDEIEKADPDALDILLTAFDEGYVKTSVGNYVDLRNIIIMITSNLGAKEISFKQRKNDIGFVAKSSKCDVLAVGDIRKTTMDAVRDWMKPELLSRVTAILPFMELTKDELKMVIDLEWKNVTAYMKERIDGEVILGDDLKELIANKCVSRGSGARYVSRLIDSYAVDPVAALYVESDDAAEAESITLHVKSGCECDTIVAYFNEKIFEYEVTMAIGD